VVLPVLKGQQGLPAPTVTRETKETREIRAIPV
jgi:hypothetical protein